MKETPVFDEILNEFLVHEAADAQRMFNEGATVEEVNYSITCHFWEMTILVFGERWITQMKRYERD